MNEKLLKIGIYHGPTTIDNESFISHFEKRGEDVRHFYEEVMGRSLRYISKQDNSFTMGVKAAKDALTKNNLLGKDIDMLIFSSSTPEYSTGPTATFIHREIEGGSHTICFDMNMACTGMVSAFDLATKYMRATPTIHRIMIVGSDFLRLTENPNQSLSYGQYGDVACALIIERALEECGLVDTHQLIQSELCDEIFFPSRGFSNMIQDPRPSDLHTIWQGANSDFHVESVKPIVEDFMKTHHLVKSQIKAICCSQFSLHNIKKIQHSLDLNDDTVIYIGDQYGYTGTSSPFIALYEAIESGLVSRGDYVILWGLGAGHQSYCTLLKY